MTLCLGWTNTSNYEHPEELPIIGYLLLMWMIHAERKWTPTLANTGGESLVWVFACGASRPSLCLICLGIKDAEKNDNMQ